MICMDLASVYRSLARKHFPNAAIIADRFHGCDCSITISSPYGNSFTR